MTTKRTPRLIARFGHRALWIWLFAGISICMAITLVFMEPQWIPDLVHTHLPQWFRATLWGSVGIVAASLARVNEGRLQWVAFLILGIAPAERLASFGIAVVWNIVDYSPVLWQRMSGFFSYLLWIGALWLASTVLDAVDWDALTDKVAAPEIAKGA